MVSVGPHAVTLGTGLAFVRLEGLRMMYSRDTAVRTLGPIRNVSLLNCVAANTGGGGIGLVGEGLTVRGCEVYGTAGCVVGHLPPPAPLTTRHQPPQTALQLAKTIGENFQNPPKWPTGGGGGWRAAVRVGRYIHPGADHPPD